jgi:hypothetical protein
MITIMEWLSGRALLIVGFSMAPFRRPVISVDLSWVKSNAPGPLGIDPTSQGRRSFGGWEWSDIHKWMRENMDLS